MKKSIYQLLFVFLLFATLVACTSSRRSSKQQNQHYTGAIMVKMGHVLHLLGDGTFRYEYWADILPRRVCDQGTWRYAEGAVLISSDNSLKGISRLDDVKYAPMYLTNGSDRTLLLIGMPADANGFLSTVNASDSDESREMGLFRVVFEKSPSAT